MVGEKDPFFPQDAHTSSIDGGVIVCCVVVGGYRGGRVRVHVCPTEGEIVWRAGSCAAGSSHHRGAESPPHGRHVSPQRVTSLRHFYVLLLEQTQRVAF